MLEVVDLERCGRSMKLLAIEILEESFIHHLPDLAIPPTGREGMVP